MARRVERKPKKDKRCPTASSGAMESHPRLRTDLLIFFNAKAQRRKGAKSLRMTENEISKVIVDAAIEVHRTLGGPGLLESVYEEALAYELWLRGLPVERQQVVPVIYKGKRLNTDLRVDLIVGGSVLIECKAVSSFNRVFEAQVLTYLRQLDLQLGLVVNFGERLVKDGIHRLVNGLKSHTPALP